jgi:hypothetical protein
MWMSPAVTHGEFMTVISAGTFAYAAWPKIIIICHSLRVQGLNADLHIGWKHLHMLHDQEISLFAIFIHLA